MAEHVYIRRGEKVIGPITPEKLRQNIDRGNIVATDQMASSAEGPWQPVGAGMDDAGLSDPSPSEPAASPDPFPVQATPTALPEPVAVASSLGPSANVLESKFGSSNVRVDGRPSFAHLQVDLGPGDTIIGEADAMASMAGSMDMDAKFNGGFLSGLKKRFLGGESLFVNHYTNNTAKPLPLTLAPNTPGDIQQMTLNGESFCLQPGAYIASTPGIKLGTRWAGLASLVGREGLFKLMVSGEGTVWYGAFGALIEREIDGQYIVDTGHLVGYEPQIKLKVQLAGGIFSSFFSGEGLVTRVEGKGKIILQTRSLGGLASWLNPFLPA